MLWTNLMKTLGKGFVVLGIIVSVIAGLGVMSISDETKIIGVLVIVIGVVGSFISAAGVMMICEISQNTAEMKRLLEQNQNRYYGGTQE